MTTLSSENYQLKWHSFSSHLHSSVASLLQSESYTDVILCTCDGGQIKAHRFVLSLCSVFFQNMFKHHMKMQSTLPVFVILPVEIDFVTLRTLIQYIYCGETTVSNDILENILKAGDYLKIRGLWRPKESENQVQQQAPKPSPVIDKSNGSLKKVNVPVIKHNLTSDKIKTVSESSELSEETESQSKCVTKNNETKKTVENTSKNEKLKVEDSDDILKHKELSKGQDKIEKPSGSKLKVVATENLTNTSKESVPQSSDKLVKIVLKQNKSNDNNDKFIVIKEEPIEWEQLDDVEVSENELFHTEMTIKPEIVFDNDNDDDDDDYQMQIDEGKDCEYSPLTCELCSETFSLPANWVKHIEEHADLHQPAKRQRRGKPSNDDTTKLPPLVCDLCQKKFPTPAEWVRHIQQTHTDQELALSNNSAPTKNRQIRITSEGNLKICTICNKRFPSHASMIIHARTHTGERPFVCNLCNKGFNVKSNLLRHLRTLHDKIVSSNEVTDRNEESISQTSM